MIQYIKGDITTVKAGLVAHGTNCSGGFGSGVAGAIRKRWPSVYENFKNLTPRPNLLGTVQFVAVDNQLTVANCFTQVNYGNDGKVYANKDAIRKALNVVLNYCKINKINCVCIPKIGSGLGGLSWENEVEPIVNELANKFDEILIKVYYIE